MLVDMRGAFTTGLSIYDVVICEVMRLPCVGGVMSSVLPFPAEYDSHKGVHHYQQTLTTSAQLLLGEALTLADCIDAELLDSPHLQLLHTTSRALLEGCESAAETAEEVLARYMQTYCNESEYSSGAETTLSIED